MDRIAGASARSRSGRIDVLCLLVGAGGYTFFGILSSEGYAGAGRRKKGPKRRPMRRSEQLQSTDFYCKATRLPWPVTMMQLSPTTMRRCGLNPQNARALSAAAEAEAKRKADETEMQRLAATAQQVVLYDEDANDPQGQALYRFDQMAHQRQVSIGQPRTAPTNVAVQADVKYPNSNFV